MLPIPSLIIATIHLASAFPVASLRVMFGLPVISSPMRCAITFQPYHKGKQLHQEKSGTK